MLFIVSLRFLTGAGLTEEASGQWSASGLIGGVFVWLCATVAVYLLNGVVDAYEDRVNGSSRPIARGLLSHGRARAVVLGSAVFALLGAAALSNGMVVVTTVYLAIGYAYSGPPFVLKQRSIPAAAVVIVAGLLTYTAGALLSGRSSVGFPLLICAVVMSAWMGFVGALAKDLSDVEGDRAAGRRTGVIVWGERRVRCAVAGGALACAAVLLIAALTRATELVLPAMVLTLGSFAVTGLALSSYTTGSRRRARLPYRAFMITQIAVHVAILVAVLLKVL